MALQRHRRIRQIAWYWDSQSIQDAQEMPSSLRHSKAKSDPLVLSSEEEEETVKTTVRVIPNMEVSSQFLLQKDNLFWMECSSQSFRETGGTWQARYRPNVNETSNDTPPEIIYPLDGAVATTGSVDFVLDVLTEDNSILVGRWKRAVQN